MFLYKRVLLTVFFMAHAQQHLVSAFDYSLPSIDVRSVKTALGAAAAIAIGAWSLYKLQDYWECAHLVQIERALACMDKHLLCGSDGQQEEVEERILSELSVDLSDPLSATVHSFRMPLLQDRSIASLYTEQAYLERVTKKWKDRVGYVDYYYRAVDALVTVHRIHAQMEVAVKSVEAYNRFVQMYRLVAPIVQSHAAVIASFKRGFLTVSQESASKRFPYIQYGQQLASDIRTLGTIKGSYDAPHYCQKLYALAQLWYTMLNDYNDFFLMSDAYRSEAEAYDRFIRNTQSS